jgi:hypothetical protein
MGLSMAGKLILKCPVPTGYLRQRNGIFFFLTIGLAGAAGYLCMGNRNLYSPSFKDLLFAAITGSVVAYLFSLLGKVRAVTFFAENGIYSWTLQRLFSLQRHSRMSRGSDNKPKRNILYFKFYAYEIR